MEYSFKPLFWRIVSIGLCMCFSFFAGHSQKMDNGVVHGSIIDVQGAVVPNAIVNFENETKVYQAISSQTGEYSIALAPAIYRVSVDASSLGFEKLKRAPIRVEPRSRRTLNMTVTGKFPVFDRYDDSIKQPMDHPSARLYGYSYEDITGISAIGVKSATVSFAKRCESNMLITFEASPFEPSAGATVTFTYDFLTATGNRFHFDRETKELTVCGNVKIEVDRDKRAFNNCVKIYVKAGKAQYSEIK